MAYNKIFFGTPGSGKSHKVRELTLKKTSFTVTFHPEYDYANFVGSYKPSSLEDSLGNHKIIYSFIPQIFLHAYVEAWKEPDKEIYLIIEEINRGNCAQIFGDLFQLLDRDNAGFSQYFINVDTEISKYFNQQLSLTDYSNKILDLCYVKRETRDIDPYSVALLPSNLILLSTMNTSDQSLFPMDSAFKRRWLWQYVSIDYDDAKKFNIELDSNAYNLGTFLYNVNSKIYNITESEDKQLGNRFITSPDFVIKIDDFISKVMFYLWFDVFKDEDIHHEDYIFQYKSGETKIPFKFSDLFGPEKVKILKGFFENLLVPIN